MCWRILEALILAVISCIVQYITFSINNLILECTLLFNTKYVLDTVFLKKTETNKCIITLVNKGDGEMVSVMVRYMHWFKSKKSLIKKKVLL